MKRIAKWALIILGVFFALGVIITIATPQGRKGFSEGAARAQSEAAQTASPSPSPSPTEEPTPVPTPAPTTNPNTGPYTAFQNNALLYANEFIEQARTVVDAANSGDLDQVYSTAMDFYVSLSTEKASLEALDVKPCFAKAHHAYLKSITTFRDSMDGIATAIINNDPAQLNAAIDKMNDGTAQVNAATEEIKQVDCS